METAIPGTLYDPLWEYRTKEEKEERVRLGLLRERAERREKFLDFKEQAGFGPHGERLKYWLCQKRFIVVAAGKRSGKTIISEHKLERKIWQRKPWKDPRYFFAGPTEGQAEMIGWQRMLDLIQDGPNSSRIHKVNYSDLIITVDIGKFDGIIHRASFHIIGLDKPARIEGVGWDGGIGDERADWKAGVWDLHMRGSLADRKGFCWMIGVPDFDGPSSIEFLEAFNRGLNPDDPEWQSFTWSSREVMPPEEIESMAKQMPDYILDQEIDASFVSAPGRAYPGFRRTLHVKEFEFNPDRPLLISCDFNRTHHNWGEYQYEDGNYYIWNDIYGRDYTTEQMCIETKQRIIAHGYPEDGAGIQFFGDWTSDQKRAEATDASWAQVKKAFPRAEFLYQRNPAVVDRLEKTNAFILDGNKKSHLIVHPQAVNHINDFERVSRTMAFAGEGGKDGELTHASSAFGYLVEQHQGLLVYEATRSRSRGLKWKY